MRNWQKLCEAGVAAESARRIQFLGRAGSIARSTRWTELEGGNAREDRAEEAAEEDDVPLLGRDAGHKPLGAGGRLGERREGGRDEQAAEGAQAAEDAGKQVGRRRPLRVPFDDACSRRSGLVSFGAGRQS